MNLIIILLFPLEGVSFPFRAIWRIHGFGFLLRFTTDERESSRDPWQVNIMNVVAKEWLLLKTFILNWMAFLHKVMGRLFCIITQCRHHLIPAGNLRGGRQDRNFSCGSGFYLTKNLNQVMNWAVGTLEQQSPPFWSFTSTNRIWTALKNN